MISPNVYVKKMKGNPFLSSQSPEILPKNVRPKVNSTNKINIQRASLPAGARRDLKEVISKDSCRMDNLNINAISYANLPS